MRFTVFGNHLGLDKNPVPYTRTTQRAKFKDPAYQKYAAWKKFVIATCLAEAGKTSMIPGLLDGKKKTRLNCTCFFINKRHGDPENIRKGIQDALFANDKYVWGSVDFFYDKESPRVEIEITR
jgi:hypothetical protein